MDAARHQFRVSIPDQLCVAGFDDIEQAAWSSYDLTTFAQPVDRIAREAVAWLVNERQEPVDHSVRFRPDLVWRSSVRGG
jgi:DNA-binding LacI/PurR family transcriptional regulator